MPTEIASKLLMPDSIGFGVCGGGSIVGYGVIWGIGEWGRERFKWPENRQSLQPVGLLLPIRF